jgi:DNA-binding IclR family transcriptional regulator
LVAQIFGRPRFRIYDFACFAMAYVHISKIRETQEDPHMKPLASVAHEFSRVSAACSVGKTFVAALPDGKEKAALTRLFVELTDAHQTGFAALCAAREAIYDL